MRKLILAILGLYPLYYHIGENKKMDSGRTRADYLKESYYKNSSKHNCFCGGVIREYKDENRCSECNFNYGLTEKAKKRLRLNNEKLFYPPILKKS